MCDSATGAVAGSFGATSRRGNHPERPRARQKPIRMPSARPAAETIPPSGPARDTANSAKAQLQYTLKMSDQGTTDFGFEKVDWQDKAKRVRSVFESVASKYDVMNDLMSLGLHRVWKAFALSQTGLREGDHALDVAGGTGDLAIGLAKQVGTKGRVVLSDINPAMLEKGRDRLLDAGVFGNVDFAIADAERLPFADNSFDCVTIGFGLRNVTDKPAALQSMLRVLKPGGQLLVLEFSKPVAPGLRPVYDAYSFKVLPLLGRYVANDEASYRYLAESIRVHPDQETLLAMMREAGYSHTRYHNLSGGIVALHRGYKI
jgi:demethylmenaquinone methyltransferase / 2-methoxy-6-polyprenyl-1,4-benzoquinol methylase